MAKVVTKMVVGNSSFDKIAEYADEIPISVLDEMLTAEADVIEPEIRENANKVIRGKYWTGTTSKMLTRKKPHNWNGKKGNGQCQIALTFNGIRVDKHHSKKSKTRNAEIAFVNEYGARGIPARPFIQTAIDKNEKQAFDSAEKIFDNWLKKENM